jgi:hypothetical protein
VRASPTRAHEARGVAFVDAASSACSSQIFRISSSRATVPSIENTPSLKQA